MREIPVQPDLVAFVDDEDYERVAAHKWFMKKNRGCIYAQSATVIPGKLTKMHKFIRPGAGMIDHEDGNGLNNQKSNFRSASNSQNQANRRKTSGTTSRFKGVTWNRARNRWQAYITVNQKFSHLGLFKEEVDAAQAYNFAAEQHFGTFARLNAA